MQARAAVFRVVRGTAEGDSYTLDRRVITYSWTGPHTRAQTGLMWAPELGMGDAKLIVRTGWWRPGVGSKRARQRRGSVDK